MGPKSRRLVAQTKPQPMGSVQAQSARTTPAKNRQPRAVFSIPPDTLTLQENATGLIRDGRA